MSYSQQEKNLTRTTRSVSQGSNPKYAQQLGAMLKHVPPMSILPLHLRRTMLQA